MKDIIYIGLEDLAANYYIEQYNKGNIIHDVTFETLEKYGTKICKYMKDVIGKQTIMILSRDSTEWMFRNYSEYFHAIESKSGYDYIGLQYNQDILIDKWIERFRSYISFYLLKGIMELSV